MMILSSAPPRLLHSTTICHGVVAGDLSLFSFPISVKWIHYTDDVLRTYKDLPLRQDTLQVLPEHL